MLQAAGRLTGRPVPELVESFGYSIDPDLLGLFRSLIRPEWRTLDLLEKVEAMHTAMRDRNPLADPPVIQCLRLSETELQLTYNSKRQLCTLTRGTMRGLATLYGEDVEIVEHSCMNRGYPFCTFQVVLFPRPTPPPTTRSPPSPGRLQAARPPGSSPTRSW